MPWLLYKFCTNTSHIIGLFINVVSEVSKFVAVTELLEAVTVDDNTAVHKDDQICDTFIGAS